MLVCQQSEKRIGDSLLSFSYYDKNQLTAKDSCIDMGVG